MSRKPNPPKFVRICINPEGETVEVIALPNQEDADLVVYNNENAGFDYEDYQPRKPQEGGVR